MRELTLDEVKQIQLSVLNVVDDFCRSNNIKYTLAAGTLIGAVRHKGYIPWDDDIDIYMLRRDYERFVAEFNIDNYAVYTHKKAKGHPLPFAKVSDERTVLHELGYDYQRGLWGVSIDIFPVDNIPNGGFRAKFFIGQLRFMRWIVASKRLLIINNNDLSFIKKIIFIIIKAICSPFSFRFFNRLTDRIATKYVDQKCDAVGNVVFGWGAKECCPNIGYDKHIKMEFEGREYSVISSYDTYLTNVFGDYMTPPPVEKQVTHHNYVAYEK